MLKYVSILSFLTITYVNGHAVDSFRSARLWHHTPKVDIGDEDGTIFKELEGLVEEELSKTKSDKDTPDMDDDDDDEATTASGIVHHAAPAVATAMSSAADALSSAYAEMASDEAVNPSDSKPDKDKIDEKGDSKLEKDKVDDKEDESDIDKVITEEFDKWIKQHRLEQGDTDANRANDNNTKVRRGGTKKGTKKDDSDDELLSKLPDIVGDTESSLDIGETHSITPHMHMTAEEEYLETAARKAVEGRDRAQAQAAHDADMEKEAEQRMKTAEQFIKDIESKRQNALRLSAQTARIKKKKAEDAAAEALAHSAAYKREVHKGKQEHIEIDRAKAKKQRYAQQLAEVSKEMERLKDQEQTQNAIMASAAAEAAEETKLAARVDNMLGEAHHVGRLKDAAREMAEDRKKLEQQFRRRASTKFDDRNFDDGILLEPLEDIATHRHHKHHLKFADEDYDDEDDAIDEVDYD